MLYKNKFLIFVISLLFLISASVVYADDLNFNFYRDNYKPFETVQINITTENITLTRDLDISNLVLLNSENNSINIAKYKVKVDNNFYVFYFDLPQLSSGNYRLGLINVNYIKDRTLKVGNFYANLDIVDGNTQIISFRPAYVFNKVVSWQEVPFSLVINNKGNDLASISLTKEGNFFNLQ